MDQIKVISSYTNRDEIVISQEVELHAILLDLLLNGNNVVLLKFPHSGVLTIGVGTPYGFVEYMSENGSPPYLVAVDVSMENAKDNSVEFDSGGTLTPISIKNCLPMNRVVEIVMYFWRDNKLSDDIVWKEI